MNSNTFLLSLVILSHSILGSCAAKSTDQPSESNISQSYNSLKTLHKALTIIEATTVSTALPDNITVEFCFPEPLSDKFPKPASYQMTYASPSFSAFAQNYIDFYHIEGRIAAQYMVDYFETIDNARLNIWAEYPNSDLFSDGDESSAFLLACLLEDYTPEFLSYFTLNVINRCDELDIRISRDSAVRNALNNIIDLLFSRNLCLTLLAFEFILSDEELVSWNLSLIPESIIGEERYIWDGECLEQNATLIPTCVNRINSAKSENDWGAIGAAYLLGVLGKDGLNQLLIIAETQNTEAERQIAVRGLSWYLQKVINNVLPNAILSNNGFDERR